MKLLRSFLIIIAGFIFIGCTTTSIRHTKDYNISLAGARNNAIVLPPEARVYETDVSGSKRLYDFEYNIENVIAEQILQVLSEKNIHARLLTRKEIHDQKLQGIVDRSEENFASIESSLYKTEFIDEKTAFATDKNLGGPILELASKTNAKLIIMVGYFRTIKSSGSQALGLAAAAFGISTDPADQAKLKIAIIDAATGKLLWMNRLLNVHATYFSSDNKQQEIKIMKEFIEEVLKKLKL